MVPIGTLLATYGGAGAPSRLGGATLESGFGCLFPTRIDALEAPRLAATTPEDGRGASFGRRSNRSA